MNIDKALLQIPISFVIERILEIIAPLIPKDKRKSFLWLIGSVFGVLLSWATNLGILSNLGIIDPASKSRVFLDYFLTGILLGGGTEPIHSIIVFLGYKKDEVRGRVQSGS
jgi:hypothetical protein